MKYITEFRDKKDSTHLLNCINELNITKPLNIMEVCGTHTVAIFRSGIRNVLPKNLKLISGPGCPVCVTSQQDIDKIIECCKLPNVIITTFGDMLRVPGTNSSLINEKSKGADVRVIYSVDEALEIAINNPSKTVIFVGVGFETTTPTIAFAINEAYTSNLNNFFVLSFSKIVPPALSVLLEDKEAKIDAFILPGHVSAILGLKPYYDIFSLFNVPMVITGFEANDILLSIYMILKQIKTNDIKVDNAYQRVVPEEGNLKALSIMNRVFEIKDSFWRGIGTIPKSGLAIRQEYSRIDAEKAFSIKPPIAMENTACICGQVLKGIKTPIDCKLFKTKCTPDTPYGACMVSSEGTCGTYYKYEI